MGDTDEMIQVNVTLARDELDECRNLSRCDSNGPAVKAMMRLGMKVERDRWGAFIEEEERRAEAEDPR